jgi:hypothetical protein
MNFESSVLELRQATEQVKFFMISGAGYWIKVPACYTHICSLYYKKFWEKLTAYFRLIGHGTHWKKKLGGTHRQMDRHRRIHRQQGDLISLLLLFQNKECKLKKTTFLSQSAEILIRETDKLALSLSGCIILRRKWWDWHKHEADL